MKKYVTFKQHLDPQGFVELEVDLTFILEIDSLGDGVGLSMAALKDSNIRQAVLHGGATVQCQ